MDIRHLKYFIAVCQAGTLSGAALKLALSQSVLSRQIQALERGIGFALYRRTGRGVELTSEGKVFEKYASSMLDTYNSALQAVIDNQSKELQQVIVGLPASLSSVVAVDLVGDFKSKYPQTSLKILEGFSGHVIEWLADGRIDVAVLYEIQHSSLSMLKPDPLLEDRLVVVGPYVSDTKRNEGEISLEALTKLPLILPTDAHGVRILVDREFKDQGLTPQVTIEIDSLYSSLIMVEAGLGYTVVSYPCVKRWVESKRLSCRRLIEPEITRKLVTAVSPLRPSSIAVRAFSSLLRFHVTKHFGSPNEFRTSK